MVYWLVCLTKNIFILTTGADYNRDLSAIWRKNFKPTKNKTFHKLMNTHDIKEQIVLDNHHRM